MDVQPIAFGVSFLSEMIRRGYEDKVWGGYD